MDELTKEAAQQLEAVAIKLSEAVKTSGVPIAEIPVRLARLEKSRETETLPIRNQIAQLEAKVEAIEKKYRDSITQSRDLNAQLELAKGIEAMLKDHVGVTIGGGEQA